MEKSLVRNVAKLLVLIGSINWGLIGVGYFSGNDLDVVTMVLGTWPAAVAVVNILIGLSIVYLLLPGRSGH